MGRPRTFTDDEFLDAYKTSNDMPNLAAKLGISPITAYKHCGRMNLPPLGANNIAQSLRIYDAYKGHKSIQDLAAEERMSIPSVRSNLMRAVAYKWLGASHQRVPRHPHGAEKKVLDRHTQKPTWPMPRRVQSIKVIHELERDPALVGNPLELFKLTNVPIPKINSYLEECHFRASQLQKRRRKQKQKQEELISA